MKIGFIKNKYEPYGGGEIYLNRLMDSCVDRGEEIHLFATKWPNKKGDNIKFHAIPRKGITQNSRAKNFSSYVSSMVQNKNLDVVVSLERTACQDIWRAGEGVYKIWLQRRRLFQSNLKTFFNEKFTPRHKSLLKLEAECVHSTPLTISNSKMVKEDLKATYGKKDAEIQVIYNGVDPFFFNVKSRIANRDRLKNDLNIDRNRKVLLFVGSGFIRKGLLEILTSLVELPECVLIVIGRDNPSYCKKYAERLAVSGRVVFLPPQSPLVPYYHVADLLVLPSWFDPFPNVGLEALFCGTPVLTSRYTGTHEVIRVPDNGEIVGKPNNIDAIVKGVKRQLQLGLDIKRVNCVSKSVKDYTIANNRVKTLEVIRGCT